MTPAGLLPETYLLLMRDDRILLLRRQNTGYEDGNYGLIAGKVERNETARQGIVREAAEEAGLTVQAGDLVLCHVMHRKDDGERVAFFFQATRWTGEPQNLEPDKCSDLSWFPVAALPANTIPYVRQAIEGTLRGEAYSEHGWRD